MGNLLQSLFKSQDELKTTVMHLYIRQMGKTVISLFLLRTATTLEELKRVIKCIFNYIDQTLT